MRCSNSDGIAFAIESMGSDGPPLKLLLCSNSDGIAFAIETITTNNIPTAVSVRSNSDGIAFAIETADEPVVWLILRLAPTVTESLSRLKPGDEPAFAPGTDELQQ